jgi:hypothetical protein
MAKNGSGSLRFVALTIAVMVVFFESACVEAPPDKSINNKSNSGPVRIGLSMDTLKEERWQNTPLVFSILRFSVSED